MAHRAQSHQSLFLKKKKVINQTYFTLVSSELATALSLFFSSNVVPWHPLGKFSYKVTHSQMKEKIIFSGMIQQKQEATCGVFGHMCPCALSLLMLAWQIINGILKKNIRRRQIFSEIDQTT